MKKSVEPIRVSKLLADRGFCSRREADQYIEKGWVKVDGKVIGLGAKAYPKQTITLHKLAQEKQQMRATIILNKPVGYISHQSDEEGHYRLAGALITTQNQFDRNRNKFDPQHLKGMAPAGRLDIDSQGLLVFTQDGGIARQLNNEELEIEKEYLVRVEGTITDNGLRLLNYGITLEGEQLRPAEVSWQNDDQLKFIVQQDKKRQIRNMCKVVGLNVVGLKLVRMGNVTLADLPIGRWRYLKPHERFL
ncbi:Ribosomal large subunit pseudouridine synthase F [Oligella ureolytica]|uniref:pseudouridine synthase n=1 Tax=Oligella ureolytica TaxID=90244 RepID=UPI000DFB3BDD|nr:pseudouridine synthase [Oligella ureolytica]SUA51929.1 Ribosomal large subunit pseudouridine synthase F [Oligella ureolytica]